MRPLRPELYNRLTGRLPGPIGIAHEGDAMWADVETAAFGGKARLNVHWPGEYYITNCPYCLDTRKRLWINHMWGSRHLGTGLNLWLAHCYNETNCMAKPGKAWELYQLLFNDISNRQHDGNRRDDIVLPGKQRIMTEADLIPGTIYPLHELPASHPASQYVRRRGFHPLKLGEHLGVGYCFDEVPTFPLAQDRLFIPVFQEGKRVGWQARRLFDSPEDPIPKYYFMPGMKKSEVLYNFDSAKRYRYVVVCEGVTDVWRVGPSAVALFGQHASAHQSNLIASTWCRKPVIILLDGNASQSADKLAHHLGLLGCIPIKVVLPNRADPGGMLRAELWGYIDAAARSQGIVLR